MNWGQRKSRKECLSPGKKFQRPFFRKKIERPFKGIFLGRSWWGKNPWESKDRLLHEKVWDFSLVHLVKGCKYKTYCCDSPSVVQSPLEESIHLESGPVLKHQGGRMRLDPVLSNSMGKLIWVPCILSTQPFFKCILSFGGDCRDLRCLPYKNSHIKGISLRAQCVFCMKADMRPL